MNLHFARRRLLTAVGATSALALSGHSSAQNDRTPIVIGHSGPFTGPLAATNKEALDVSKLVFDQLNAHGGINGRPLVLETLDDAQDVKRAADNTHLLIEKQRAIALFAYRTSPVIEAVLPISAEAKVPFVAPQVVPSLLYNPPRPQVFGIRASYHDEIATALELLFSAGFTRVAFLYANDAFGRDVQAGVAAQMKHLGGQPAAEVWIENTTADAGETVRTLRDAKPMAIVIATNNRIAADAIKKYRALSRSTPQFVTLSNNSSAAFIQALEGAGRGVMVTQVLPFPYTSLTRAARELRSLLDGFGKKPSYAAMHGFLGAKLIVEGLRRAKEPSAANLMSAFDGNLIDLGGYTLDYTHKQRKGSRLVEITMIGPDGLFYQ